jgi:HTH-type transcriptional regulator/antitoxin HigA
MTARADFQPDWVSPPGETVLDILEQRGQRPDDLARDIGESVEELMRLLRGERPITPEIAQKFEVVVGGSAQFWITREAQYRARLRLNSESISSTSPWLDELPLRDMTKSGWLSGSAHSATSLVATCLRFFGVDDVAAWRQKYAGVLQAAAFRRSPSIESKPGAVAAWLRQGEIMAAAIACQPWDAELFKDMLQRVRPLTREKNPAVFLPSLRDLCSACGVAFVVLRAPTGCRASGATWFIASDKALLLLSFRYLSDDHFWFTFFHEAGHLLLHGNDALFLEGLPAMSQREEEEANHFSALTLIPAQFQSDLRRLPLNGRAVMRFAREIGVSPGIVVGQLQHLGCIRRNQLNNLKRRFTWSND